MLVTVVAAASTQDSGLSTQTVYSTTKYMVIYKGDEIKCGTIVALHGMTQMYLNIHLNIRSPYD